ncbi:hypothetical protein K469DRAFT_705072 [Zopfia rhizophila CBS 207.26]|uniref:Phospholipid/glycerol acyltransferase domain-containing protein n=1 Tax=Zopfia rhizophila CBS 207.26 TaxID=1314779 RepID=A0A6A6E9B9_9PEZI|nr:hypothetical protein K469DRAFT_705072 [Zopfia rhizophila CBS 207.26]
MERYSQFRDKGTAIAPFFPVPTPPSSTLWTPVHLLLFLVRIPPVLCLSILYFLILEWLPVGSFVKKCVIWFILGIPGVWWIDLQVDGVRRGKLAESQNHLPYPGTIIASSFTSPLDPLYLAGIFCPIFTRSYPSTRKVERISLFRAILLAFSPPSVFPTNPDNLTTLKELQEKNPKSIIVVFPECTTTNGRGILPFSPSLLTANPKTRIYPINLRYTPGDITTPVPGNYGSWLWRLLSEPTHCMHVRIAESVYNNASITTPEAEKERPTVGDGMGFDTNIFDSPRMRNGTRIDSGDEDDREGKSGKLTRDEQKVLDRVGEDLARLGRVKRVGLGVQEKIEFVKVWGKRRR